MTLTAVHLEIPGKPRPLKRPRFTRRFWRNKRDPKVWTYNCQEKEMNDIRCLMKSQYRFAPLDEPLQIFYIFYMQIPKYWSKEQQIDAKDGLLSHTFRPDISNLIKFYEDCMNEVIFVDDSLIVRTDAIKIYSTEPKTKIWIRSLPEKQLKDCILRELEYGTDR